MRQVRPAPPPEPVIRFETPAGRQAQVDFARVPFPVGRALRACSSCSATRGCCGAGSIRARTCATLIDGLEDAFRCFGGVPQELLFDQMKAVITRDLRLQGGALVRNLEFLRFAHHWGFTPRACRPVSRADQGQGRASGPLPARQFRLRPDVPQ